MRLWAIVPPPATAGRCPLGGTGGHNPTRRRPRTATTTAGALRATGVLLATLLTLLTGFHAPTAQAQEQPQPAAETWSDKPDGFAATAGGTTGAAGGKVVTVRTQQDLTKYAAAPDPYTIRIAGSITVDPFGSDIIVASNKTLIGVGTTAEIVHGELHLNPGTHNVIIRNLTIRDSYVEGDWDGKTQDFDAIQMDSVHHVWIDHNTFTHMGDGLLDIRKDSDYVTVSWNVFKNHNKAFGLGWTDNVTTNITVHHNWFTGIKQRSPSIDNAAHAHLYNNYLSAQYRDEDPVWTYGNWSRGRTKMVIENSYYDGVRNPYQADETAELVQRGSIARDTTGRHDTRGDAFDPRDFYSYRLDPAAAVPALVKKFSGPQSRLGTDTVLRVAADGSGDFRTVQAAVNAVPAGNDGRITIAIAPGTYREQVRVPADKPLLTFLGTGRDRGDTVIVYDTPAEYGGSTGSATVLIAASDVTARHLTFVNDFDEAAHDLKGEQALAMKTTGDRIVFTDTAFKGNQDTLMTDSPKLTTVSRVYLRDAYIEGDVDFIYGRATTVIERSTIKALSRGSDSNNGYITAASTWKGNPYGFLITRSRIVSDAPDQTFHLGRPWHPGGEPDAIAQVLIRDTWLPAAIKSSAWTDMSGFPWQEARFSEYRNTGPGATPSADRPRMTEADAADHEVADYLAGSDGWAPQIH